MTRTLLVFLFAFFFIVEGTITTVFSEVLHSNQLIYVSHFLFIILVSYAIFYDLKEAIIVSLITGILFDITYSEVLSIYAFGFPIIVYLIYQLSQKLDQHLIVVGFLSILGVTLLEFYTYAIYLIIEVTQMPFQSFVNNRLLPTLFFNLLFFVVISFPIKRLFLYLRRRKDEI